jgi:prepilin-type N-terminal cleavage/methylation domain-containing protein
MTRWRRLRDEESGFTLIELLVSMIAMTVLTLAAVFFLEFTTEDVSHITERVSVNQKGRIAMENVMLRLHSACVSPSVAPILEKSNATTLTYISETGTQSALTTVQKHELIYTPASGSTEGTITEKTYNSESTSVPPNYTWSSTAASNTKLLKGVRETTYQGKSKPVFQYYRYYQSSDTNPVYGELETSPLTVPSGGFTKAEAAYITKVTVSFTLAPEGKESVGFNHDRPIVLEDSALFRLAPSSESSSNPNLPCSEKT